MITTIRIDKELQRRLKIKSIETGQTQSDLANEYIRSGLKNNQSPLSLEEIEKLLAHDLPEGDMISKKLIGLAESPVKTNAVELKKSAYKRGGLQ